MPHDFIKDKLNDLIERTFQRETLLSLLVRNLHVMTEIHFLLRYNLKNIIHG